MDIDVPRLISASASSFSHLPSCTTKLTNSLGQSTVCEGKSETDNDKGSFKLRTSISSASHFTLFGFFPLIAWVMADYLRLSRNLTSDPYKHEVNNFTHFFLVLGFFKVIHLVWEPKLSQAKWKEKLETSSILFHGQKLRGSIPSLEITYPLPRHFLKMSFLVPRWDMLVP